MRIIVDTCQLKDEFVVVENGDIQKLARICGMLSSPHDGERASAALLATKFLSARKMTWEDLIFSKASSTPPPPPPPRSEH